LGETVVFQVAATDNVGIQSRQLLVNDEAIALDMTYSLDAESVAKGMKINQYGRIPWQPQVGNVGAQAVVVTVTDPNGDEADQSFSLVSVGETVVFQVAATDDVGIQARQLLVNGHEIALECCR
jgi:large repetitive protein